MDTSHWVVTLFTVTTYDDNTNKGTLSFSDGDGGHTAF